MSTRLITLICLAVFGLCSLSVQAQETPAASPTIEMSQKVGLTDVSLVYSRPGVKDRTVYASDGLVPFGEIWRTGANAATKITFSKDVVVGGKNLSAGSYAILTKPGSSQWEVMFYPYESGNWGSYTDMTPAATITAEATKTNHMVETFLIFIDNVRDDSATIDIVWENTVVSIPLEV